MQKHATCQAWKYYLWYLWSQRFIDLFSENLQVMVYPSPTHIGISVSVFFCVGCRCDVFIFFQWIDSSQVFQMLCLQPFCVYRYSTFFSEFITVSFVATTWRRGPRDVAFVFVVLAHKVLNNYFIYCFRNFTIYFFN